eukprot:6311034-Pyramimonas_sp.AAC.1
MHRNGVGRRGRACVQRASELGWAVIRLGLHPRPYLLAYRLGRAARQFPGVASVYIYVTCRVEAHIDRLIESKLHLRPGTARSSKHNRNSIFGGAPFTNLVEYDRHTQERVGGLEQQPRGVVLREIDQIDPIRPLREGFIRPLRIVH